MKCVCKDTCLRTYAVWAFYDSNGPSSRVLLRDYGYAIFAPHSLYGIRYSSSSSFLSLGLVRTALSCVFRMLIFKSMYVGYGGAILVWVYHNHYTIGWLLRCLVSIFSHAPFCDFHGRHRQRSCPPLFSHLQQKTWWKRLQHIYVRTCRWIALLTSG